MGSKNDVMPWEVGTDQCVVQTCGWAYWRFQREVVDDHIGPKQFWPRLRILKLEAWEHAVAGILIGNQHSSVQDRDFKGAYSG